VSTIADVWFAHDDGALVRTLTELPGADATVLRETSTDPSPNTYFIRFENVHADAIRPALASDHTVRDVTPISTSETRQVWSVQFTEEAKLLNPMVADEGGFVFHARCSATENSSGWRERWFLPTHDALYTIWQRAREEKFEFEIFHFNTLDGELSAYSSGRTLTDDQRDALALAYERGYFTVPREASLDDLADELGLSPAAVAGRLKRGMKVLIEESLLVDDSE